MHKVDNYHNLYPDEHPTDCKIIGRGTIKFVELDYMDNIKKFCQIDETIKLEYINEYPEINVCVGKSNLDECKSEISNIETYNNADDWIWLPNVNIIDSIKKRNNVFITDTQITSYGSFILTANADLTIKRSDVRFVKDSINDIVAQHKTAKLTLLFIKNKNKYYPNKEDELNHKDELSLILNNNNITKSFDFNIYCYSPRTALSIEYREDIEKDYFPIRTCGVVYIREPYRKISYIFKKIGNFDFVTNDDFYFRGICYSDNIAKCSNSDLVLASTYEELIYYDKNSQNRPIIIAQDADLFMNNYTFKCNTFRVYNKVNFTFYLPNKATVFGYAFTFDIITNKKYVIYTNYKATIGIDDTIFLNFDEGSSDFPSLEFTGLKNTFQIIPNINVSNAHISPIRYFTISDGKTLTCPVPSVIQSLFENEIVVRDDSWSYFYLSEEGKNLLESIPSLPFDSLNNDDDLNENIVISAGKDDVLLIPSNWTKMHNVYILQKKRSSFLIEKPYNITYQSDGLILNEKFKILNGKFDIKVPQSFSLNSHLTVFYENYMYKANIVCSENLHTHVYVGSIKNEFQGKQKTICFSGYNSTNGLTFHLDSEDDMHDLGYILSLDSVIGVNYNFEYDYICYSSADETTSKCTGKFYHADDITTIMAAIKENPGLEIMLYMDLTIPYSNGDVFILNPSNDDIIINLPDSPTSISITNKLIIVKYKESTVVQISNSSIINVEINDDLEIDVNGDTDSKITLSLGSNVFVSTTSQIKSNFTIAVNLNSFHLYAENANIFGSIFGDSIESINRVCAYDSDAYSICSFDKIETIDNVFKNPFEFSEAEIALSTDPVEIVLPTISNPVKLNILKTEKSSLTVGTASSIQMLSNSVIVDEFWRFIGDLNIFSTNTNSI